MGMVLEGVDNTTPALPEVLSPGAVQRVSTNVLSMLSPQSQTQPETQSASELASPSGLQKFEKNVDVNRTAHILRETADGQEINDLIDNLYGDGDDEDDADSLCSEERLEIERHKSNVTRTGKDRVKVSGKLYRPQTTTPWRSDEMEEAEAQMKAQMDALNVKQSIKSDPDLQTSSDNEDGNETEPVMNEHAKSMQQPLRQSGHSRTDSPSKLFRNKSAYKWNADAVNTETEQMKKQMKAQLHAFKASKAPNTAK